MRWMGLAALSLVVFVQSVPAAEQGLLFYVPFESDPIPTVANGESKPPYNRNAEIKPGGKVGNAVSVVKGKTQLIYDGPGNAFTTAGTISFFWRPDEDPATGSFTVVDMSPFERMNYSRFMRISFAGGKFSVLFTAGYRGMQGPQSKQLTIKPNEWHHLAMAWDQTRGMALYLDGEVVLEYKNSWIYDGHFNQIGMGQTTRADFRPDTVTASQSYDELRVYDRWLDDASIKLLGEGKAPVLKPVDPQALLKLRRDVYRWADPAMAEELSELKVGADGGLALRQVGIKTATDVRRTSWRTFDGERARRFPGGTGYANSGDVLDIVMDGSQTFDLVQIYGSGKLALSTALDQPDIVSLDLGEAIAYHGRVLPKPVTADKLAFERVEFTDDKGAKQRAGVAYEVGLFERGAYRVPAGDQWQKFSLAPTTNEDQQHADFFAIRQNFYSTDQQALVTKEGASQGAATFPSLRPVHLVGPQHEKRQGLGAVAIDLSIRSGSPNIVRVEIADPITPQRYLTAADVRLTGGPGKLRLLFDHRDVVLMEGRRPRVNLTFNNDAQIDLADSSISYQWLSVDAAMKQHFPDQMARAKDVFQEISEARQWPYAGTLRAVGLMRGIIAEMYAINPKDEMLISYWHWINPGLQKAIMEPPPVPDGVPAWAVYLDQSIESVKQVPYWWIDHRENEFGEFGANDGINDDTDLVMDWWAMHLMRGPDERLIQSLKRVANRSWEKPMGKSGLGHTTDALHNYEDGVNAQCHMALMDYGNPVYVERMMATARHYKELLGVNPAGHLHFYDDRYGWTKAEDGTIGTSINKDGKQNDEAYNALTLQPAILLGWYNGNEYCIQVARDWTDAMLAHMIVKDDKGNTIAAGTEVTWGTDASSGSSPGSFGYGFLDLPFAMWELTGEQKYLDFVKLAIQSEIAKYGYPRESGKVIDRYIQASGDQSFKDRMVERTKNPNMWKVSLHNDNYYDLDTFYLAWQLTGDTSFIDEGTKLTLNDSRWQLPMLTEAEQSTDRVWTPQRLINRIALGGPAMLRNELYPKLAASWEGATTRIAPFVTSQDAKHVTSWIQNLDDKEAKVTMRFWRLQHGHYAIEEGTDADRDGKIDSSPQQRSAELGRFESIDLTIPPKALYLVKITQTQPLDDLRQRPDLAICADDATYDPATGEWTLVVHNIGSKPTGESTIKISSAGKTLLEKSLPSLDAPSDLQPRVVPVTFKTAADAALTIELTAVDARPEITKVNNRLELSPKTSVRGAEGN